MEIRRIRDPLMALGVVAHFVAHRPPFSSFKAGELIATLDGQIRREHYLIAFEGARVVGYLGWALFDEATTQRLCEGRETPTNDLASRYAQSGDVVWLLTAASITKGALRRLIAVGRGLHPGKKIFGVRHNARGASLRQVGAGYRRERPAVSAESKADTEILPPVSRY